MPNYANRNRPGSLPECTAPSGSHGCFANYLADNPALPDSFNIQTSVNENKMLFQSYLKELVDDVNCNRHVYGLEITDYPSIAHIINHQPAEINLNQPNFFLNSYLSSVPSIESYQPGQHQSDSLDIQWSGIMHNSNNFAGGAVFIHDFNRDLRWGRANVAVSMALKLPDIYSTYSDPDSTSRDMQRVTVSSATGVAGSAYLAGKCTIGVIALVTAPSGAFTFGLGALPAAFIGGALAGLVCGYVGDTVGTAAGAATVDIVHKSKDNFLMPFWNKVVDEISNMEKALSRGWLPVMHY